MRPSAPLLWKGRKSAFGAIARIKPNYYLHDTVIPRTRLVEVLEQVYAIADEVRPARDERLPRGRRQLASTARLRRPGARHDSSASTPPARRSSRRRSQSAACCRASTASGSRSARSCTCSSADDDLEHQAKLRRAFDPVGLANPGKVLPSGSSCGDVFAMSPEQQQAMRDGGAWL